MRIRRSVTRFFGLLVVPAICMSATGYFGYYAFWGGRGILALSDTRAHLLVEQEQLASLRADRMALQHRIQLLEPGSVDPDMVEELARSEMLDSSPGQIAIPRDKH
jgi:cell division protein FtsB